MTTNESWIFQPWMINRWLESALGFPPWFIVVVIDPILVLLLFFLFRELCLRILFLFESPRIRKETWRRFSFYLTVFLGLFAVVPAWIKLRISNDYWVGVEVDPNSIHQNQSRLDSSDMTISPSN